MKKLKTLIVDDEEYCLLYLRDLLNDHRDIIGEIYEANSYSEAIGLLSDHCFDLSILDNKLDRNKDSFELVRLFKSDVKKFGIIVYTSTIRNPDLENVLEMLPDIRFYKPYDEINTAEFIAKLKKHKLDIHEKEFQSITIKCDNLFLKIPVENIFYIGAVHGTVEFFCRDEKRPKYVKSGTLSEFDYLRDAGILVKCSRSNYINPLLIKGVNKSTSEIHFVIDHQEKIPPVSYSEWFIEWLNDNGF